MGWLLVTKGPSSGSHDGGKPKVDRVRQELMGRASGRDSDTGESNVYRSELGKDLSSSLITFPTSGHRKGGDAGAESWLIG